MREDIVLVAKFIPVNLQSFVCKVKLHLSIVLGKTVLEYSGVSFDNWLTLLKSMNNDADTTAHPKLDDYGAVIHPRLADMEARGGDSLRLMNGV